jgi:SHS family lactate transporter-like MFS transporter
MHFETDPSAPPSLDTPGWRFAVASGILGWILDAFDFFVVVFLLNELMARYSVSKVAIVATIGLTLAMRPIGALFFGVIADKYGRKGPLIACVAYFSTVTVLSGLAPTYTLFLICRCLYGIGMGGYWGIGASYAMESAPREKRGFLSGMMQAGYPFGYLLAAIFIQIIPPHFGWHTMFFVGSVLALVIIILTVIAPESDAWRQTRMPSLGHIFRALFQHLGTFGYLLLLMAVMTCLSHGTQDLYPDFLKSLSFMSKASVFGMKAAFGIPVVYNIGAIIGALCVGQLSETVGRRKAIMLALGLSLLSIPAWAFGGSVLTLVIGAFAMQTGVQGAFGVIPAHLNELSPDAIRGLFPGFVYQLGVFVASPVLNVQTALKHHLGYPWALTSFELCVIGSLLLIFGFGPEKHGKDFRASEESMVLEMATPSDPELDPTRIEASRTA